MSELDTCWVCTPGGKAHVSLPAGDAFATLIAVVESGGEWLSLAMPNGGEAIFRTESITCINSHVEPRQPDVRTYRYPNNKEF